jgi:hypothetical protein
MKAHVQKLVGLAALSLTLLTTPVPTWAGYRFTPGVAIYPNQVGGSYAKGSMVGTRYSADAVQYIGCTATATSTRTECYAKNTAGAYLYCSSTNGAIYDTVQAMTDSSSIQFQVDGSGTCTSVNVYHGSERLR